MTSPKRILSFALACALMAAVATLTAAAGTQEKAAVPGAKKKAPARSDFTSDLVANMERAGQQLISLAEAMPADRFSWRPNDSVRTVSQIYMHVVGPNMLLPARLGAAPPGGLTIPEKPFDLFAKWESEVTEKDQVIARLRESFDYALAAIRTIPAADLDTETDIFGFPASKRAYLLILMSHAHEHLGQAIAYARSVGVVPPWSAPAQAEAGSEPAPGDEVAKSDM